MAKQTPCIPISRLQCLRAVCVTLLTLILLTTGCRQIREQLGIGETISEPEKETPEWVAQRVLAAATQEPFAKAWADYSQYLHSSEQGSPVAMKEWETLRFPALRRKHKCFLQPEAGEVAYELMERKERKEDYIELRIKCKTTEMPTPCHLKKDAEAGGKWRVVYGCMN